MVVHEVEQVYQFIIGIFFTLRARHLLLAIPCYVHYGLTLYGFLGFIFWFLLFVSATSNKLSRFLLFLGSLCLFLYNRSLFDLYKWYRIVFLALSFLYVRYLQLLFLHNHLSIHILFIWLFFSCCYLLLDNILYLFLVGKSSGSSYRFFSNDLGLISVAIINLRLCVIIICSF